MAKKPRTPDPPRKVQAPQVRQKQSSAGPALPWTNILIGLGTVVIVGLVVALFVVVGGGGGSSENVSAADITKVKTAMTAADCTFTTSKAEGSNQHIPAGQKVKYVTFPAGSGRHDSTTAIWGNYARPADPRQAVHNLEHGGIAIWYGPDTSEKDRRELAAFYDDSPNGLLITPLEEPYPGVEYPKHDPLGSKLALSVWTAEAGKPDSGQVHIAVCPGFDEAAFAAYRDTFLGKGPERFPVSEMTPGNT